MRAVFTQFCCALLISVVSSGCNMMAASMQAPQTGSVHTWIDAPLDGSTIPLAPYEVVLHAYDASGVTEVELSANGSVLTTLPNADAGLDLVTLRYTWSPPAPGNYTLSARAKSGNGLAGSEARSMVTVLGEVATAPPSFTPTVVVSFTPTLIPSFTPTPVPAELVFTPQISASEFFSGSCGSNQVTIQVHATGSNLSGVLLFLKLRNQSSGETTDWDGGSTMTRSGSGWFSRTVNAASLAGAESMSQAWLLYQFIATDSANKIIGRSQVYSDITLASCGPVFQRVAPPTPVPQFRRVAPTLVPQFQRIPGPTLIPPPP